jgi:hypothetical protein
MPDKLRDAKKMPDGSYKCLTCQTEEIQDGIIRVTPNSKRAQEIIAERKGEEGRKLQMKMFEARIKNMHGKLVS